MAYTIRAILWAVATSAGRGPKRAFFRREYAPNAHKLRVTEAAAWRKACPARLSVGHVRQRKILPPEISLCGARPNQEAKCCSVGHFDISVPISDTRRVISAREALIPCTATRSTPVRRNSSARVRSDGWPQVAI